MHDFERFIKCVPEVFTKRKTKSNAKYVYNSVKMQISPVSYNILTRLK